MNRRTFLKTAGFSSAALVFGGIAFRVGSFWWDQTAAEGYKVLSAHEARVVQAIADAMFPGDDRGPYPMPNGAQTGLREYFDEYLDSIPPLTSKLLRVLIHAIDDMSVISDFGMTRFHLRPQEERIAILHAWDTSLVDVRRGAFRSIKLILGMGYCEHPEVLRASGIQFSCSRGQG